MENYWYSIMSCVIMPSTNGPNDGNKKVKKGGRFSFNAKGWTTPLYANVPPLLSVNLGGGCSFTRKTFANKYDLCCVGLSPKQVLIHWF
jgi:hypothetical protein